jgi:hypothetical protein
MEDKMRYDIENYHIDYDNRKEITFSMFIYDAMLMQYGLKTIAVKNIISLCNSLRNV